MPGELFPASRFPSKESSMNPGQNSNISRRELGKRVGQFGAAVDALKARGVRQKLVAMADAFQDRMNNSFGSLSRNEEIKEKFDVSPQHKFIGFEAYKQAMDVLSPGDVAIFATP